MSSSLFANKRILYLGILLSIVFSVPFLGLGGGSTPQIVGLPIAFDHAFGPAKTPFHGASSVTISPITVSPNETIVVTTGAVACPSVCGTTIPFVTSVSDIFSSSVWTQRIALINGGQFSLWTGVISSTIAPNSGDSIFVSWNQSTVGIATASTYANVKGIGAIQPNSGTGTAGNFTIITSKSGSWIVGGTMVAHAVGILPNSGGLIQRSGGTPSSVCWGILTNPPCVNTDLEDTNSTQYINGFPFPYSSQWQFYGSFQFAQGAVELTPILTEPTDQTNERTGSYPLGTWISMPSTSTELLGNTTYRGILSGPLNGYAGLSAAIAVGCITQSNTLGASLQLQYALETSGALNTGFQNVGQIVFIDGSTGPDCISGGWVAGQPGTLNSTVSNQGYIFRVMGSGGGGTGDNPRFSFVSVTITENVRRNYSVQLGTTGLTTISFQSSSPFAETGTKTVNVKWMATNLTGTTPCGTNDLCVQAGQNPTTINAGASVSATVTVTYPVAFTGSVQGTATCAVASSIIVVPAGVIQLLQAQTVTV